jgi:hypothetical protein
VVGRRLELTDPVVVAAVVTGYFEVEEPEVRAVAVGWCRLVLVVEPPDLLPLGPG